MFDSGEIGELLYYVMTYVEGESLRARMKRDSAIRYELGRRDHEIRRTAEGFARTPRPKTSALPYRLQARPSPSSQALREWAT